MTRTRGHIAGLRRRNFGQQAFKGHHSRQLPRTKERGLICDRLSWRGRRSYLGGHFWPITGARVDRRTRRSLVLKNWSGRGSCVWRRQSQAAATTAAAVIVFSVVCLAIATLHQRIVPPKEILSVAVAADPVLRFSIGAFIFTFRWPFSATTSQGYLPS